MYTKINRRKTFTSYHWQQYNTCYAVKQLPTQKSKGQFKHVRLGSGRFNIQQLPF